MLYSTYLKYLTLGGDLSTPLLLVLSALFYAGPGQAQAVYKCGNTFSQTPCAPDAKKIEVRPSVSVDCKDYKHMFTDACRSSPSASPSASVAEARDKVQRQIDALPPRMPPDPGTVEANKKRCLDRIMSMLKDPESARVGEVSRAAGPAPDYETSAGWFPSVSYTVTINAKNSYGGYTGNKLYACSFDLEEKDLLRARSF